MTDTDTLRIALCQMNATVGDIAGNEQRIKDAIAQALAQGVGLILFPELALTGYPPEDLLLREHFLREADAALGRLAMSAQGIVAIVGTPLWRGGVYNVAAVLADGAVVGEHRKVHLPNYGVFDEQRYFQAGTGATVLDWGEHRIGLTVCEDIWEPGPPAADEALAGATLIVNLSASPYHAGKGLEREAMVAQRATEDRVCVAFCALVGGQDELVFDGHSFVCDHTGAIIARAAQFREELLVCELNLAVPQRARNAAQADVQLLATLTPPPRDGNVPAARIAPLIEPIEAEIYAALETGLRDYVTKNGFDHVVIGLSGGIDSALVAAIAHDALGPTRVSVVVMPSPYSTNATQGDARELAARIGVQCLELEIAGPMAAYDELLADSFAGHAPDITEENLQARIRGNLLMALSNKFGWLVLTTGNKSEMSVGYSTLYGDSAGGFALIKDLEKTAVYALSRYRNTTLDRTPAHPIPDSIIERAPSAELRHDQRDQDSLPPYHILDAILRGYVEEELGRADLISRGLPQADVDRVIRLVDLAEYKRRQAPPGIKITARAFGRDRRMPITNRFRQSGH